MSEFSPNTGSDPKTVVSRCEDVEVSMVRPTHAYTDTIKRKSFLKGAAGVAAGTALASPVASSITALAEGRDAAGNKPFAGQTLSIAVGSFMVSGVTYAVPAWEKLTGAKVTVSEIPISDLYTKLTASLSSGGHVYDAIFFAGIWASEFAKAGWILPLDKYYDQGLERNWPSVLPAVKHEMYIRGKRYTVPLDGDMLLSYYRTDAIDDPAYQRKFKSQFGYNLQPPQTWTQFLDTAKFFTGWNWDKTRRPGYGVLACMKPHDITPWYLFQWAAPYAAFPGKPGSFYFDVKTMKPHINNPAFVRALTEFVAQRKYGPQAMLSYGGGDLRGFYVSGHYALANDWADIGIIAQDPNRSTIKGKLGYFITPGTHEVWDNDKRRWVHFKSAQHAPFLGWGGWQGAIASSSKVQDAAFNFLAFLDTPANALTAVTTPDSARNPYHTDEFNPRLWTNSSMHFDNPKPYLDTILATFNHPNAQPDLRIPLSGRYYEALDRYIQQAIVHATSPQAALDGVYKEWEGITDQAGRNSQREYYRSIYGL